MIKFSLAVCLALFAGSSTAFAGEPTISQKVANPAVLEQIIRDVNSELAQYHQHISTPEELKYEGVIERRAQNQLEFGFQTRFENCNVYVGVHVTADTGEFVRYGTQPICIFD